MHAYWQEYAEEHARPVNEVMHLFEDRDLDAGHRMVNASVATESVERKTHTITSGKVQGPYWNRIKCKEHFGNSPQAVIRQAAINLDSRVWKSLEDSLPEMYCADIAEAYVTHESTLMCKIERCDM
jgi:hypothetical protein